MATQARPSGRYFREIKNNRALMRLVINNGSAAGSSGHPPLPLSRSPKVRRELFDMTHTRIGDLAPSDLLQRPLRDAAPRGHLTPAPLGGLELHQNVFVHGTHAADNNPVSGFTQPSNGVPLSIRSSGMGRPRQPSAPTSMIGAVFTQNAEALLPVSFPSEANETARIAALAKRIKVGKETIRRAIRGGASSRLDIIDKIANGLGVTTPELLTSGFGAMRAAELQAQARQEPTARSRATGSTR